MEVKTITQGRDGCKVSGAYKLIFPIRKDYYHIRNDGTETAYASVFTDSTDTAEDGVYDIPSGGTLCIRSHGSDTLYVSGEVTVMGTASAVCPFKIGLRGGDGYADVTATGNPVQLDGLQGGVPFSEIVVSGDDIVEKNLTVNVCGKNLAQYPYIGQRVQAEGITMVDNGDGSVTVNGRCDTIDATFYMQPITLLPDTGYVLSGCPAGGSISSYRIQLATNNWSKIFADFGSGAKIRVNEKTTFGQFRIIITKGTVCDNLVFRPQLELGDTATEFELYHGAEYTITPDSNPYVIPNDIRQQEGYNVISVSAGELSVSGVRKNAALKRVWKEIDDIKTAIIVSNGESE